MPLHNSLAKRIIFKLLWHSELIGSLRTARKNCRDESVLNRISELTFVRNTTPLLLTAPALPKLTGLSCARRVSADQFVRLSEVSTRYDRPASTSNLPLHSFVESRCSLPHRGGAFVSLTVNVASA